MSYGAPIWVSRCYAPDGHRGGVVTPMGIGRHNTQFGDPFLASSNSTTPVGFLQLDLATRLSMARLRGRPPAQGKPPAQDKKSCGAIA